MNFATKNLPKLKFQRLLEYTASKLKYISWPSWERQGSILSKTQTALNLSKHICITKQWMTSN